MNAAVRRLLALAGVLCLVLLGSSCAGDDEPALADATKGDCVVADDSGDQLEEADCGKSMGRDYVVLDVLDEKEKGDDEPSVCDDLRDFDLSYSPRKGEAPTLCLQQRPEVGECIDSGQYVDCESDEGLQVLAVVAGKDASKCPRKATRARVYKDAEVTVCGRALG